LLQWADGLSNSQKQIALGQLNTRLVIAPPSADLPLISGGGGGGGSALPYYLRRAEYLSLPAPQTAFVLPEAPSGDLIVTINGISQTQYTRAGLTVSLPAGSALAGDDVLIYYIQT
jgi:hypothetical protein